MPDNYFDRGYMMPLLFEHAIPLYIILHIFGTVVPIVLKFVV